jgi:predicted O-methyltransferase YrrM
MNANGHKPALPIALQNHPWRNHAASLGNSPPTMLAQEELNLLHWLAANYFQGEGAIIDAGCFLGGSTHALASGLAQNANAAAASGLIHSYDLFTTSGQPWIDSLKQYELPPNQSFADKFRNNVAQHSGRIEVHAGNLLEQSWGSAPVEILFLDVCKSPELHDHAARMWFPRLIPGRSIVVQQDYGWVKSYWCAVMMEVFRDHFEVLDDVPVASRVYRCTKAISETEAAEKIYAHLSADDKLRHMEAAVASAAKSPFRDLLLVNYALLADNLGLDALVEKLVFRIFKEEKSERAVGQVVRRLPKQFVGPDNFSLDKVDEPKLSLICQTSGTERLCLYTLVAGLQPKRVLEIGRARGGSTLIIANALKRVPGSKFVSLDPNTLPVHSISPDLVARLSPCVTFIDGFSPADNPKACAAAGGKFDFVFIDANHYYQPCLNDIHGVIPFLNDNAVILFHDAHFLGVKEAIRTALEQEPSLSDCGLVSTGACYSLAHEEYLGEPSIFGGLHMLRFHAERRTRNLRLDQVEESERKQGNKHGKRPKLPFFGRVRREFNRVLGRKLEV